MPKSSYRRKCLGVSYILSVLVMTVVTVSLSSVVLFWTLRTVDETQTGFTLDVQARMDRSRERMLVETVQFVDDTTVKIFVRNVGTIQFIVDQIYIDSQQATINLVNGSPGSRLGVSIQRSGNVEITSPFTLAPGTSYSITIATSRGNIDVAFWTF